MAELTAKQVEQLNKLLGIQLSLGNEINRSWDGLLRLFYVELKLIIKMQKF